jgi:C4-type Zn-finger protein
VRPKPAPPKQEQRRQCPICKGNVHVSIDDKFLPHFPKLNSPKVCDASNRTYREACDLTQK